MNIELCQFLLSQNLCRRHLKSYSKISFNGTKFTASRNLYLFKFFNTAAIQNKIMRYFILFFSRAQSIYGNIPKALIIRHFNFKTANIFTIFRMRIEMKKKPPIEMSYLNISKRFWTILSTWRLWSFIFIECNKSASSRCWRSWTELERTPNRICLSLHDDVSVGSLDILLLCHLTLGFQDFHGDQWAQTTLHPQLHCSRHC